MTTVVAIPLQDNYLVPSREILEQLNKAKAPPQADNTVNTMCILIDYMFELTVDGVLDAVEMKPFAHKLVHQVSAIVHKALHVMVKKVVGKLSNSELKPLVEYFKSQEIEHKGNIYLGYQLEDRIEDLVASCFEHLEKGNIEIAKAELVIILEDVIESTLEIFMLEALAKVRLGMIARKMVDFTHTTIYKAVPPALHKIIDHMEKPQLEQLKDFLLQFLIKIDA